MSTINIYSILTICGHRYYQLKVPFMSDETITKKKILFILFIWFFVYLFWILSIFLNDEDIWYEDCYFSSSFVYIASADFFAYLGPIISIIIINILIAVEIQRKSHSNLRIKPTNFHLNVKSAISKSQNNSSSGRFHIENSNNQRVSNENRPKKKQDIQKESKACLCVFILSISLISTFGLFLVSWPLNAYCKECVSESIKETSYWIVYLFSSIDPLIVLVFNKNFHNELNRLFKIKINFESFKL